MIGPISGKEHSQNPLRLPESEDAIQMPSKGPLLSVNQTDQIPIYLPNSYNFTTSPEIKERNLAHQALREVQENCNLDNEEAKAFIDAILGER